MSQYSIVIPARMHSTRLPNKPILDIGGIPMVIRTALQAKKTKAQSVLIATDHQAIVELATQYQIDVVLTSTDHPTGTDRLAEVAEKMQWSPEHIVVNVQGDEPFIEPEYIESVAHMLANQPHASIATVACPIQAASHLFNPNCVKVVCDQNNQALYFSRAPIPWARDHLQQQPETLAPELPAYLHIGLYAYTTKFLRTFPTLPKGVLEQWECLEQLRALEHGHTIVVNLQTNAPQPGIDTPEDLMLAREYVAKSKNVII